MIERTEKEYHEELDDAARKGYEDGFADGDEVGYERGCEAGYQSGMTELQSLLKTGPSVPAIWKFARG